MVVGMMVLVGMVVIGALGIGAAGVLVLVQENHRLREAANTAPTTKIIKVPKYVVAPTPPPPDLSPVVAMLGESLKSFVDGYANVVNPRVEFERAGGEVRRAKGTEMGDLGLGHTDDGVFIPDIEMGDRWPTRGGWIQNGAIPDLNPMPGMERKGAGPMFQAGEGDPNPPAGGME